ncbi:MAG: RpiB/LacA/LacB family sugar-phosphate isomerase [Myxococcales bacterium]|nr:RpiB/LacA/LacB family sugar-phosphate isomerase [Myxococcales bacterium]
MPSQRRQCSGLGERVIGVELGRAIVEVFFSTVFAGGHHQMRLDKIATIEAENSTLTADCS